MSCDYEQIEIELGATKNDIKNFNANLDNKDIFNQERNITKTLNKSEEGQLPSEEVEVEEVLEKVKKTETRSFDLDYIREIMGQPINESKIIAKIRNIPLPFSQIEENYIRLLINYLTKGQVGFSDMKFPRSSHDQKKSSLTIHNFDEIYEKANTYIQEIPTYGEKINNKFETALNRIAHRNPENLDVRKLIVLHALEHHKRNPQRVRELLWRYGFKPGEDYGKKLLNSFEAMEKVRDLFNKLVTTTTTLAVKPTVEHSPAFTTEEIKGLPIDEITLFRQLDYLITHKPHTIANNQIIHGSVNSALGNDADSKMPFITMFTNFLGILNPDISGRLNVDLRMIPKTYKTVEEMKLAHFGVALAKTLITLDAIGVYIGTINETNRIIKTKNDYVRSISKKLEPTKRKGKRFKEEANNLEVPAKLQDTIRKNLSLTNLKRIREIAFFQLKEYSEELKNGDADHDSSMDDVYRDMVLFLNKIVK